MLLNAGLILCAAQPYGLPTPVRLASSYSLHRRCRIALYAVLECICSGRETRADGAQEQRVVHGASPSTTWHAA
jgi:hypothetical protein